MKTKAFIISSLLCLTLIGAALSAIFILPVFAATNQNVAVRDSVTIRATYLDYYKEFYFEEADNDVVAEPDTKVADFIREDDKTLTLNARSGETVYLGSPSEYYGFTYDGTNAEGVSSGYVNIEQPPVYLKAYYKRNIYTLSLNFNDGQTPNSDLQYRYEAIPVIENPTRAGYDFDGWTPSNGYQSGGMILEDTTLTANWIRYNINYVYVVTNDASTTTGFTNGNPVTYCSSETITFADLSRSYYDFLGFFTASTGGTQVTEIPVGSTGDITIYARFTAYELLVSYENFYLQGHYTNGSFSISNGVGFSVSFTGSGNVPATHTIVYNANNNLAANTFSLTHSGTSSKGGSVFKGWSETGGNNYSMIYDPLVSSNAIAIADFNYYWYASANAVIEAYGKEPVTLHPVWDISTMQACLTEGTMISTSLNEAKPVEDLVLGENILIWNHDIGQYDYAPVILIQKTVFYALTAYLHFDDGTEVGIVYGHSFFSLEENKYVDIYANNVESHLGEHFYKVNADGTLSIHKLIGFEAQFEEITAYGIVTAGHYNHIANGFISAVTYTPLFNMFEFIEGTLQVDEAKRQADIELYGLLEYEVWEPYLTYEEYIVFNATYMSVAIGKGLITFEDIVNIILSDFPRSEVKD